MQNNGVTFVVESMHRSSAKDKSPIYVNMSYFGVIEHIWELYYTIFWLLVFGCKWVDNNNGVQIDELGFMRVDLNKEGYKDGGSGSDISGHGDSNQLWRWQLITMVAVAMEVVLVVVVMTVAMVVVAVVATKSVIVIYFYTFFLNFEKGSDIFFVFSSLYLSLSN